MILLIHMKHIFYTRGLNICELYIIKSRICKKGIDQLTFYSVHGLQVPIFKRIAAVVLPVATVSGDVERIFSISGKICSPDRSCLTQSTC